MCWTFPPFFKISFSSFCKFCAVFVRKRAHGEIKICSVYVHRFWLPCVHHNWATIAQCRDTHIYTLTHLHTNMVQPST